MLRRPLGAMASAGLLCIGGAAHAMSPIRGIGINLAIQDAVATANLLIAPLAAGTQPGAFASCLDSDVANFRPVSFNVCSCLYRTTSSPRRCTVSAGSIRRGLF